MVTVVAVAGLACMPLVTGASAAAPASTASTASTATLTPKCAAADLGVWVAVDQTGMAAGTWYLPLEFTNLSHRTCTLHGFPGVSAISSAGVQLGNPAIWDNSVKATTVRLMPGATAYAMLAYSNALAGSCPSASNRITAFELRVYPPDQFQADHAMWSLPTCTAKGYTNFLRVLVIAPGIGVRGENG
jgi:hypothetical protein